MFRNKPNEKENNFNWFDTMSNEELWRTPLPAKPTSLWGSFFGSASKTKTAGEFDQDWNDKLAFHTNLVTLLKAYLPYEYNRLSLKHHTEEAKRLIQQIEKGLLKSNKDRIDLKAPQNETLLFLHLCHTKFTMNIVNAKGEFARRLAYAFDKYGESPDDYEPGEYFEELEKAKASPCKVEDEENIVEQSVCLQASPTRR